jgi:hypothetical protein
MKKRIIYVLNWDKYQARSDKELPWLKLWGRLFKAPWFVTLPDDEKFVTIAILDMARQFNNRLTEEMLFKKDLKGNYPYLRQIYGLFMDDLRLFNLCNYLAENDFLSDNIVGLEGDKIRQEEDKKSAPRDLSKQICLKDINCKKQSEAVKHKIFNQIVSAFKVRGWRTDPDYVKRAFGNIVLAMNGHEPKDFFPYFRKVAQNYINENADAFAADARMHRGQEKKMGMTVMGVSV